MSEVSTKSKDITRSTVKEALKLAKERKGEGYAKAIAGYRMVGQLVEVDGRKMMVIDSSSVADLSLSPEEAPQTTEGFAIEVGDVTELTPVTDRSFVQRVEAFIQFGKDYSRRYGIARSLAAVVLSGEEEAFEGFSEDATMTDVVMFWANKLDFDRAALMNLSMLQMMGQVQLPFDVRDLTAVEDRVAAN